MKITFATRQERDREILALEAELKEATRIAKLAFNRFTNAQEKHGRIEIRLEDTRLGKVSKR